MSKYYGQMNEIVNEFYRVLFHKILYTEIEYSLDHVICFIRKFILKIVY